jgi:ABC-type antimicrobial peptide transport system permease subunit
MTQWRLILKSLRYYVRPQAILIAGVAISTAVLVGALAVGDSVRITLREQALTRLGQVHYAMQTSDRFFRDQLGNNMAEAVNGSVVSALQVAGIVVNTENQLRVNNAQILGVDESFWKLAPQPHGQANLDDESVIINDLLAEQLRLKIGDELLLRMEQPDVLSRDAPLSSVEDSSLAFRLNISAIYADANFGHFSLRANQAIPFNIFVDKRTLQEKLDLVGRSNLMLVGISEGATHSLLEVNSSLQAKFTLDDAHYSLVSIEGKNELELRNSRIFLDDVVSDIAVTSAESTYGLFSYFVNELRSEHAATPYSMVSTTHRLELPDDNILVSQWLADDLSVGVGDTVTLSYYVLGPMRKLEEKQAAFTVKDIYPMDSLLIDRDMMPEFPGISDSENCSDWDPGIPIDLDRIRDKDEAYWDDYRGTPKALISLSSAQSLWQNRFGRLTAVRFAECETEKIEATILEKLDPAHLGFAFRSTRSSTLAAGRQGMDFGGLFLGFSFFLILAALILLVLLFILHAETRSSETGTLMAIGFSLARVRKFMFVEISLLAVPGIILGALLGIGYAKSLIASLATIWSDAIGQAAISFHLQPSTLLMGGGGSWLLVVFVTAITLWRQKRLPVRMLLAGQDARPILGYSKSVKSRWTGAGGLLLLSLGISLATQVSGSQASGIYFTIGAALLLAGFLFCSGLFIRLANYSGNNKLTLRSLGLQNTSRRHGRSLAVIIMLACGLFLIISLEAFRVKTETDYSERSSGTGGFTYFGESSLPIYEDLNSPTGRENYGLDDKTLESVAFASCRLRAGDEASCLNLNRAQTPNLLGVNPQELTDRKAFDFKSVLDAAYAETPWMGLNQTWEDGAIPVIADYNSALYALGLKLGDCYGYTDEKGNSVELRLVGLLNNSILQGYLVVSEQNFTRLFSSESGYQRFLIDAPEDKLESVSKGISYALQDVGLALTPAAKRLARFNAVQNTYLSIFQVLGGLGLLLGTGGLAIVVFRNVSERRGEFAMLKAIGFRRSDFLKLVLYEHWGLLAMGLIIGVFAAAVAILPSLILAAAEIPLAVLATIVILLLTIGMLWIAWATQLTLRGPLMQALRNE